MIIHPAIKLLEREAPAAKTERCDWSRTWAESSDWLVAGRMARRLHWPGRLWVLTKRVISWRCGRCSCFVFAQTWVWRTLLRRRRMWKSRNSETLNRKRKLNINERHRFQERRKKNYLRKERMEFAGPNIPYPLSPPTPPPPPYPRGSPRPAAASNEFYYQPIDKRPLDTLAWYINWHCVIIINIRGPGPNTPITLRSTAELKKV